MLECASSLRKPGPMVVARIFAREFVTLRIGSRLSPDDGYKGRSTLSAPAFAAVIVEAAVGFAAEPAGLDIFHQERARAVLRIGEALIEDLA